MNILLNRSPSINYPSTQTAISNLPHIKAGKQRVDLRLRLLSIITYQPLFIQDSHCIRSNQQFFISRDHYYLHS